MTESSSAEWRWSNLVIPIQCFTMCRSKGSKCRLDCIRRSPHSDFILSLFATGRDKSRCLQLLDVFWACQDTTDEWSYDWERDAKSLTVWMFRSLLTLVTSFGNTERTISPPHSHKTTETSDNGQCDLWQRGFQYTWASRHEHNLSNYQHILWKTAKPCFCKAWNRCAFVP